MRSLRILRWQMSTSVDSKVASSTNLAPRLGAWSRLGQPDAYALSLTLTRRQGAWGLRAPATCQQGCQFLSCGPTTGPTSLLPHSADHSQSWSSHRSKGGLYILPLRGRRLRECVAIFIIAYSLSIDYFYASPMQKYLHFL